jgi:FMN phosphatase YigB (HAD superfamily)
MPEHYPLSSHTPELPALVDALGLTELVEQTSMSAAIGAEKPSPAIFELALGSAGLMAASDAWMIADNPIADIQGAHNVGIRVLLADGAYSKLHRYDRDRIGRPHRGPPCRAATKDPAANARPTTRCLLSDWLVGGPTPDQGGAYG